MSYYMRWKPYVPIAERRAQAQRKMVSLSKKGIKIVPVEIQGRKIARTFWGTAWCDHMESFSDFDNRLPRGRTYVRNGSVCHLGIKKGKIEAKVSGSELYDIKIKIDTISTGKWNAIKKQCSGKIGSLLELLKGNLSDNIMQVVTDRKNGLFPHPDEISFDCNCPDWAYLCKHLAAVLYGIGARLDQNPDLLFLLRGVKHEELIDLNSEVSVPLGSEQGKSKQLSSNDLADMFDIDLEPDMTTVKSSTSKIKGKAKQKKKKSTSTNKKTSSSAKSPSKTKKKTSTKKKAAKSVKKIPSKKKIRINTSKKKKTVSAKKSSSVKKKTATKKKTVASVKKKLSKRSAKNVAAEKSATKITGRTSKKKTRNAVGKKKTAKKSRATAKKTTLRSSKKRSSVRSS